MGAVVSKAANGIGAVLGNAFAAPFKAVFGDNCDNVCSGTWDITCFIEHLCVTNIVKLVMVFGLLYITLMFMYLLFQLGLIQCIVRSLCKMCWSACETYWFAMEDITCFLWYKLKNTKRVHRRKRRFKDVEEGYSSSDNDDSNYYGNASFTRRPRSFRERRKERMQRSHHPLSYSSKDRNRKRGYHHDVQLKTSGLSVHLKGGSGRIRNSRQLQVRSGGNFKLNKRKRFKG